MNSDIKDAGARDERELPETVPHLRFLKVLVGGLAVAMVLGLAAIVAILWVRLGARPLPELPAAIALPEGATPQAVTFAGERLIVVTGGGEVLIYDAGGRLSRKIELDQP